MSVILICSNHRFPGNDDFALNIASAKAVQKIGRFFSSYYSDDPITIDGDFNLAGAIGLSGTFSFSKVGNTTQVGVIEATVFLGENYKSPQELGIKITDATGGLIMTPTGVATNISGSASVVGLDDFSLSGNDLKVVVNTTGAAVNETITVGSGTVTVLFADGSNFVQFSGTLDIKVDDFVNLSGGIGFEKSGTDLTCRIPRSLLRDHTLS